MSENVVPSIARHNAEVLAPIYSRSRFEVNHSCTVPRAGGTCMCETIGSSKQIPKSDWSTYRRNASRMVYGDKRRRGCASEAGQQYSRLAFKGSILLTLLSTRSRTKLCLAMLVLPCFHETILCYVVRHLATQLVLR